MTQMQNLVSTMLSFLQDIPMQRWQKKKKSSWNSSMNIWLDVRPTLQDGSHNRQCLGNQEPELDSSEL